MQRHVDAAEPWQCMACKAWKEETAFAEQHARPACTFYRDVRKRRRAMAAVPGKRKTSFQKECGSESVRVPGIVYVVPGKPMAYGRVLPAAARNQCRNFR